MEMEIDHPKEEAGEPQPPIKEEDLFKATEKGDSSIFKALSQQQLLRALYLWNEDGLSLLHVAASSGHVEMSEYVDDTEDFIDIMLDDKQNQLLQMGVMLSTTNMILNGGIVVVGLFGMNIGISLYDGQPKHFWGMTFATIGGCVALYMIAVGWGKKKTLI